MTGRAFRRRIEGGRRSVFFRGEQARSTPGSGLGLALVQAVAMLHDGALVLEDAAPGLRAVLTLRAAPTARNASAAQIDHSVPVTLHS